MDTGIPLFFPEIQYLLLETIPLEIIMRVIDISTKGKIATQITPQREDNHFLLPNFGRFAKVTRNVCGDF